MKISVGTESFRLAVLAFLLIICAVLIYYSHFILRTEVVFTHLFYIPIILAGLWWSRKGIAVAGFLALILLILHVISPLETPFSADIMRASMFVVVGTVVAILSEKRRMLADKLLAYSTTLEQKVEERTFELKEAQEKQRAILDGIGDAVVVLDNDRNAIWANKIAIEQYGLIPGKKCYDSLRRPKEPCPECIVLKTFEDGEVRSQEQDGVDKDGNRISFIATCSPVRDVDGVIISVVEVFHDITDRKRADEALRKVTRALRVLSECNQVVIRATEEPNLLHNICRIIVDIGGYRLVWVGFAEQDEAKTVRPVAQMGYEAGYLDTVSITWADTDQGRGPTGTAIRCGAPCVARHILTDPNFEPWRTEALKRGFASSISLPLTANSLTIGALNIYAAEPDAFDPEEVKLLMELADDMSYGIMALRTRAKHQRAEETLRKSEKRFREMADLLPQTIYETDERGNLIFVNRNAFDAFGYTEEDFDKGLNAIQMLAPDNRDRAVENVQQVLSGEKLGGIEYTALGKNGSSFPVIIYFSPIIHDNKAMGLRGIIADITDRKEAEDRIKQSLREKETLLSEIHHRVKNNMQIISSLLSLQSKDIKDERALSLIKNCEYRIKAMSLVHEKLYLSKDLSRIDFHNYMEDLSARLFQSHRVDSRVVSFSSHIKDVLFNIETAIPLGLIINEIISNAIKHAFPEGRKGNIAVKLTQNTKAEEYTLTVTDDGIGFPEEIDYRNTETFGLQLVDMLTEQLNGTMELDRSKGTSFKIVFKERKYKKRI